MITYNVDGVKMPKIKKRDTSAWIRKVAASHGRKVGEIGYMFVDDEKILEVNNEYLGHDYYTDVITFDYDEDDVINGDIVISLDTVRTNAEQFGKTYDDELHRVIIHGILHLLVRLLLAVYTGEPEENQNKTQQNHDFQRNQHA